MYHPFTPLILQEIAPELGIRIEMEPAYGFAGELIFADGSKQLFHNANLNLNPAAATQIANDKGYTCFFLRKHGIRVPQQRAFFADQVNQKLPPARRQTLQHALAYAQELGYPVFVKPNNLSQGAHVTKVWQPEQILQVGAEIFARNDVLLVEQTCSGRDYRVVVFDGEVFAAYERVPLCVNGDGKLSITELIGRQQQQLHQAGRLSSEIDLHDPRIDAKLQQQGLSRASVPPAGEKLVLLDNANLSTGGTSSDISGQIHRDFIAIAKQACQIIGLRLAGVDFLAADLTQPADGQDWHILELNAAPGMENYAAMGARQRQRVKDLYRRVLQTLAQQHAAEPDQPDSS